MKKIFISFAAIAALVSCVEEKGLEPQQPVSGNQLTIKAVTAPATKTVLGDELPAEGISVLWEEDDAIAVVLKDANSGTASKEFAASLVDGTNADFTGEFTDDDLKYFDTENVTDAYAIYPSASVSDGVISHTLSEVQNGKITSGMNLAYAALDADEVLDGTAASATFNNALVLIQITVPEGVQYVSLSTGNSGDELAGTATYTYKDGVWTRSAISGFKRTVTLKNDDDSALAAGTYSLLVFPSTTTNTLTLKMEGTDEAVYEKSLNDIKLMASQCYTINLEKLSYVGEVLPASPVGGEFVIPFVTTEDYTYTVKVEIAEGDDENWIVYEQTRGFHKDEIVLALEANDSGKERSANVTVTIENVGSKTFVVSQPSVLMELIEDENGDPIQWEESFGVYASEDDAVAVSNAKATFKNVFTISLSDDYTKGAYKITNMFAYNNGGATYYADYANGELTVYTSASASPSRSYYFKADEVILTYDSANKTFKSKVDPISAGTKFDFTNNFANKDCFIGGYSVAVKSNESNTPEDSPLAAFVGNWTEKSTQGWSTLELSTMVVSVSEDKLLFENMFIYRKTGMYGYEYSSSSYYGTLSSDGKTITLEDATEGGHPSYGPMEYSTPNSIVLTVGENNVLSVASVYNGQVTDYTATKQ